MNNKLLVFLFMFLFIGNIFAENIPEERAKIIAKNFYFDRINAIDNKDFASIKLTSVDFRNEYFHVFNVGRDEGYVVVSADDRAIPILAYSFEMSFETNPNFDFFLNMYQEQIKYARENNVSSSDFIKRKWKKLINFSFENTKDGEIASVNPLIFTKWNQSYPWNAMCPADVAASDGRVPVGCVATAAVQVMKYYNYPEYGIGSHSYYASGYGTQSVNFGSTFYDWQNMPNEANGGISSVCIDALATISYHCGVSIDMGYGADGSGAYTQNLANVLPLYFGYSYEASAITKASYSSDNAWVNDIKEQLDAKRPMVYAGNPEDGTAGHAWVCDGYQIEDGQDAYFHMNFGWGGSGNGYSTLDNIITYATGGGSQGDFNMYQKAIINLYPDDSDYPYHCNSNNYIGGIEGSFDDGSVNEDYQSGNNCNYIIEPTCAAIYSFVELNFDKFDVNFGDILKVYDGNSSDGEILGEYTYGDTILPNDKIYSTKGNGMFINFTTDELHNASGWNASYKTNLCPTEKEFGEKNAVLNDGSGLCVYGASSCKYILNPNDATTFTLNFSEFDMANDGYDQLRIYRNSIFNSVATYSADNPPTIGEDIVINDAQKIIIKFLTNGSHNGDGWTFNYTSDGTDNNVGIIEKESNKLFENFNIYPNPTKDFINVSFDNENLQDIEIDFYNALGKKVYSEKLNNFSGSYEKNIDFSRMPEGIYFLKMKTENGSINKKVLLIK